MEIKITVNVSGVDPIEVKVDVPVEGKKKVKNTLPDVGASTAWFNSDCVGYGWTTNAFWNREFLIQQQKLCNERLKAVGYLFENEVREVLGLPKTPRGQLTGWIWNPDDPIEQDVVDFGIYNKFNVDFVNGACPDALLDFNVRGDILKYL